MAEKLVSGDRCTARAACRHFGLHRSTYAYRAKEVDAWGVKFKGALRRKSNEHPELGYAKITRLLKQEGWQVGARNVRRLRREPPWVDGASEKAKTQSTERVYGSSDPGKALWASLDVGFCS